MYSELYKLKIDKKDTQNKNIITNLKSISRRKDGFIYNSQTHKIALEDHSCC